MRLLICGDRRWVNKQLIIDQLIKLSPTTEIIHGCAAGADTIAGREARRLGLTVHEFPAQWALYGRAAGPIRNLQMLREGKPQEVWAFHDEIEKSKGTAHMVRSAHKANLPVIIFTTHSQPRLVQTSLRGMGLPL